MVFSAEDLIMSLFGLKMIIVAGLLLSLVWMDICLYFRIQSLDESEVYDKFDSDLYKEQTYNISFSMMEPLMSKFSFIFTGLSVKMMMTDPIDNYVTGPLADAFAKLCDFRLRLLYISPDIISYVGVISAFIAAKLVACHNPILHKSSFVFFQLRTWLDDLDGTVARSRLNIYKHVSLKHTSGYVIDGICDGIGFVVFLLGCHSYLKTEEQHPTRRFRTHFSSSYDLEPITSYMSNTYVNYTPIKQFGRFQVDSDVNELGEDEEGNELEILFDKSTDSHELNFEQVVSDDQEITNTKFSQHFSRQADLSLVNPYADFNDAKERLILHRYIKEKIVNKLDTHKLTRLFAFFIGQLAMCSFFWNRYILVYRDLLETPSVNILQAKAKRRFLKSNIMFMLIWFWRLTNGHFFMQMLVFSMLIGQMNKFLELIKYAGFIEITLLSIATELHTIDIGIYLKDLA